MTSLFDDFYFETVNFLIITGRCKRKHCTNFPDIAQEKSRDNIEQKHKIVRNIVPESINFKMAGSN